MNLTIQITEDKMISNKNINKVTVVLGIILSLCLSPNIEAQVKNTQKVTVVKVRKTPRSKVVYVNRKRNARTVVRLPRQARIVRYNGITYHYNEGVYYRKRNGKYVVVTAPRGIRVKTLPVAYRRLAFKGVTYFYASGVYYKNINGFYEVTSPREGLIVQKLPVGAEKISIDDVIYYEYANTFYRLVETENGLVYKVSGVIG